MAQIIYDQFPIKKMPSVCCAVILGGAEISEAIPVARDHVGVDLTVPAGASAVIQYTAASLDEIALGKNSWFDWGSGVIANGSATSTLYGCSAVRVKCLSGAADSVRAHIRN